MKTSNWIKENILDKGIENVRFFAQMERIEAILPWGMAMTSSNNITWVECKIDESRYKVEEGYKLTLKSLDPNYTYNHYYQSDFESLVKEGCILVKDNEADHIQHITWAEPLCGNIYVVHEADVVSQ
jgi:hypothetical protein